MQRAEIITVERPALEPVREAGDRCCDAGAGASVSAVAQRYGMDSSPLFA